MREKRGPGILPRWGVLRSEASPVACDLIPYPLLLKEKGDDCDAAPVRPSLSFRRGTEGEVAGRERPRIESPRSAAIRDPPLAHPDLPPLLRDAPHRADPLRAAARRAAGGARPPGHP